MRDLEELTTHCIRCGFCIEACPTFRLTGNESQSPRGRIYLVRSAVNGVVTWEDARASLETCLGCLACETACPSGVDYEGIIEMARERLGVTKEVATLLETVNNPLKMRLLATVGHGRTLPRFLAKGVSPDEQIAVLPRRQGHSGWKDLIENEMPRVKGNVYLLEGCAMRALFPRVHEATRRLLRRVGYRVLPIDLGCCGAMAAHAGQIADAHASAQALIAKVTEDVPIIVNSAGCGSAMKEYGEWLGNADAEMVAKRTFDISEFLLREGLVDVLKASRGLPTCGVYHDACHLAHGQNIRQAPRDLLAAVPGLEMVDLPESDMCCGSAGIYNIRQPAIAKQLLDRKWGNVEGTGARIVILGNPGCHTWIAQAAAQKNSAIRVLHLAETLEIACSGVLLGD